MGLLSSAGWAAGCQPPGLLTCTGPGTSIFERSGSRVRDSYAAVWIPLFGLQEEVLLGSECLPKPEIQVPEMRQQVAGAAMGSRLRYHLEEELGSQELGAMLGLEDRSWTQET